MNLNSKLNKNTKVNVQVPKKRFPFKIDLALTYFYFG